MTATTVYGLPERREIVDRRLRPTPFWSTLRRRGRRRTFRRQEDAARSYLDHALPESALLTLFVVIASTLDAYFTLLHLNRGHSEANPLMHFLLTLGPLAFVGVKVLITGLGTWLLALHQNFRLGCLGLRILAAAYVGLLAYHVFIFLHG